MEIQKGNQRATFCLSQTYSREKLPSWWLCQSWEWTRLSEGTWLRELQGHLNLVPTTLHTHGMLTQSMFWVFPVRVFPVWSLKECRELNRLLLWQSTQGRKRKVRVVTAEVSTAQGTPDSVYNGEGKMHSFRHAQQILHPLQSTGYISFWWCIIWTG